MLYNSTTAPLRQVLLYLQTFQYCLHTLQYYLHMSIFSTHCSAIYTFQYYLLCVPGQDRSTCRNSLLSKREQHSSVSGEAVMTEPFSGLRIMYVHILCIEQSTTFIQNYIRDCLGSLMSHHCHVFLKLFN